MEYNFVLDPDETGWERFCFVCLPVFNLIMYPLPWESCLTNTARETALRAAGLHSASFSLPFGTPTISASYSANGVSPCLACLRKNFTLHGGCVVTAEQLSRSRAGRAPRLGPASPSPLSSLPAIKCHAPHLPGAAQALPGRDPAGRRGGRGCPGGGSRAPAAGPRGPAARARLPPLPAGGRA